MEGRSVICVVFDEDYEFEDVVMIGRTTSSEFTRSMMMEDILRVMKDSDKTEITESRSEYDNPIIILHTDNKENALKKHWHYYCLFEGEK